MGKTAVYYRVSTAEQNSDAQRAAVERWMTEKLPGVEPVVYEDRGFSGKRDDRPQFKALCAAVTTGDVSRVVVFRLDRLSRVAVTAMKLLLEWIARDIEFFAADQPILQLGKNNPMRLTICSFMAEMAQLEREAIVARVKSGIKAAQDRGVHCGRKTKQTPEVRAKIRTLRLQGHTYEEIAEACGVSRGAAYHWGKDVNRQADLNREPAVGN